MKALHSRTGFAKITGVVIVSGLTHFACGGRSALDDARASGGFDGTDAGFEDASSVMDAGRNDSGACTSSCTSGASECRSGLVSTCAPRANGCTDWGAGIACRANATCEDDAAGAVCVCNAGYSLLGGTCERDVIAHLRPIAPLSTATVTSQRPRFRWELGPGEDGAEIDVCFDHACARPLLSFFGGGTSAAPTLNLSPGAYFWRVRGMTAGVVSKDISIIWEFFVGNANAPVNTSWGSIVDVNGDGFADVASTAFATYSTATVGIYLGGTNGIATTPIALATSTPTVNPGKQVTSAGDVNGDGYADLLVFSTGAAEIYFGGPNWASTLPVAIATQTASKTNEFAYTAAGADDVNGDGYADVVIGSPDFSNDANGIIYVYFGSADGLASAPLELRVPIYEFGDSVSGVGDVNGDGFADIATTANPGLFIFLGGASGPPSSPVTYSTLAGGGSHIANGIDLNGDGYADVVVGQPNLGYGDVDIRLGGASSLSATVITLDGSTNQLPGIFGFSIASAGDVNGDGFGDIVVGTSGILGEEGGAAVYAGNAGGISAIPIFLTSPNRGGMFGWSVAGSGDTNGDGYSDVAVGGGGTCTSLFLGDAAGTSSTAALITITEADGYSVR